MPSIERPLSGDVLVFDLDEERSVVRDAAILERSGRNARTLVKDGPLRVTLVELAPEGELAEHSAAGPITIHPIEGRLTFTADGREYDIGPEDFLTAGAGVPHRVHSAEGATFLLTVVTGEESGRADSGR